MTLDQMEIGKTGTITKVHGKGVLRHRLLDMGLTPRTEIMVRKVAPFGDPIELCLRGYELTIRRDDAKNIEVEACGSCDDCRYHGDITDDNAHVGHSRGVREKRMDQMDKQETGDVK